MRAALYTRVSSQEQAQHGVSLAEQKERLKHWAKAEGWEIAGIYTDEGYTGGNDNRPDLQRLMADAKTGAFNIVAVTKIDRFFRNTRQLLNYIHDLESYGIPFMAQVEGIDTSKPGMGKVILSMLGSVAEWERERIGNRVSDFRQHLASKGQWSSGRTPFGYRFDKKTKELIIEPLEAEAIKFIFQTYTDRQVGIVQTAELANKEGVITPRAGRRQHTTWTQSAIRHVLTHPSYKGGPSEDWQFNTPAIITDELWESAQRQMAGNRHFRAVENHNPFTGLLRCGLCGYALRIGYNHSTSQVWECPGRLKRLHLDGSPRCTLPRLPAEGLTAYLAFKVTEIFSDPDKLQSYINDTIANLQKEKAAVKSKLKPLKAKATRLEESMTKADTMFELGRLNKQEYQARIRGIRQQLRELENQTTSADPMLLKQLDDYDKAIKHYTNIPEMLNKWLEMTKSPLLSKEAYPLAKISSPFVSELFNTVEYKTEKTEYGHRGSITNREDEAVAKYLRQFGLYAYIYPDKVEFKGAIRQSNISSACRSGRCPLSQ